MTAFAAEVPGNFIRELQEFRSLAENGAMGEEALAKQGFRSVAELRMYYRAVVDAMDRLATWQIMLDYWRERRGTAAPAGWFVAAIARECLWDWQRVAEVSPGERGRELRNIAAGARDLARLVSRYEVERHTTLNEGAILYGDHPFFEGVKITRDFLEAAQTDGTRRDGMLQIARSTPAPSAWLAALAREAERAAAEEKPGVVPARMGGGARAFRVYACRWIDEHAEEIAERSALPRERPARLADIASALCDDQSLDVAVFQGSIKAQ
jgi:hypothetical protein